MKKLIIFSLITFISLIAIHFTTFKTSEQMVLPVSSIEKGNLDNLYISLNGDTVKTPNHTDFYLIKDKKYGNPHGSFTLTKQVNVFGFTRYEATMVK